MTCKERYLEEHKEPIRGCPHWYGYLKPPSNCFTADCLRECWERELPKNVNDKEGNKRDV